MNFKLVFEIRILLRCWEKVCEIRGLSPQSPPSLSENVAMVSIAILT